MCYSTYYSYSVKFWIYFIWSSMIYVDIHLFGAEPQFSKSGIIYVHFFKVLEFWIFLDRKMNLVILQPVLRELRLEMGI